MDPRQTIFIWTGCNLYLVTNKEREFKYPSIKNISKINLEGCSSINQFYICFLEVTSLSPTNLRATENLYGR
jgi:hypothetical protein